MERVSSKDFTEFFVENRQRFFFLFFHFFLIENATGCFESADESVYLTNLNRFAFVKLACLLSPNNILLKMNQLTLGW